MIRLYRDRRSDVIPGKYHSDGRTKSNAKLIDLKLRREKPREGFWKDSKPQLKVESYGKCAYCEAYTASVVYGDVEHYRPKSIYWWLAYCYDNYLFACAICNQQYKRAHFPVFGENWSMPEIHSDLGEDALADWAHSLTPDPLCEDALMQTFVRTSQSEGAGLINPYEVDPEPYFAWLAEPTLKEVSLIPRLDDERHRNAVESAEKYYGLNREELRRLRWKTYEQLDTFRQVLEAPLPEALLTQVKSQVGKMLHASAQFAGMSRYFVRDIWALDIPAADAEGCP